LLTSNVDIHESKREREALGEVAVGGNEPVGTEAKGRQGEGSIRLLSKGGDHDSSTTAYRYPTNATTSTTIDPEREHWQLNPTATSLNVNASGTTQREPR